MCFVLDIPADDPGRKYLNTMTMNLYPRVLTICFLILKFSCFSSGQGIIINSGTNIIKRDGNLILSNNWINNGTFTDSGGILTFAGTTQRLGGTSATTFNNITVSSGSSTTILNAGQKLAGILLVDGTLNADGNLTLLSTTTGTALINGAGTGQVYGNITMERYLPSGFGYKYFSSPFQAATVNEFGDDINLASSFTSFYRYDEARSTSGWISYKIQTNVLSPIAGYAVNCGAIVASNTVDVTGVVNNGTLSSTLYNHNNTWTKGFSLVGNPYPSPIDWSAVSGWTKTNIDNAIYYFKASSTDQYGGTYSTFIDGFSSDGLATNIIPSMQGFFVHVTDGPFPVTGVLQMDNSTRVTNQSHLFLKGEKSISLLRFTASFSNNLLSPDYSVVYFDPKASSEFNGQLDALKLMNTDLSVPNVYLESPTETKISIKALPYVADTIYIIPLGLKINHPGEIIFKILDIEGDFMEMKISITDNIAGAEQNLLKNEQYMISLAEGEYNTRFFLNLSNKITDITANRHESDRFSIYYSLGVIKANIDNLQSGKGTLVICNLLGQILFIDQLYGDGYHEFNHYLKDGIYLTALVSGKTKITKKILIIN
jgi:hypothetical protein